MRDHIPKYTGKVLRGRTAVPDSIRFYRLDDVVYAGRTDEWLPVFTGVFEGLDITALLFARLTLVEVSGFPLDKGTTWVYSYEAYDSSPSDPEQVIKTTYQLTDTVIDTQTVPSYFVAHVKRDWQLVQADPGWLRDLSSQPREFWYVVDAIKSIKAIFRWIRAGSIRMH